MSMDQIGKLLEIVGFLIATGVAGIFLERRVLGIWAGKSEVFFGWLVNILNKIIIPSGEMRFVSYVIKVPPKQSLNTLDIRTFGKLLLQGLLIAIIPGSIVHLVFGWLFDIDWLFWAGIVTLSVFIFIVVINILLRLPEIKASRETEQAEDIRPVVENGKKSPSFKKVAKITVAAILSIVLIPIILLLLEAFALLFILVTSSMGVIRILQILATYLAGEDTLRRILIVSGAGMILAGLIFEFVAIF